MDDPAVRKQMLPLFPITLLGVAVDLWLRPTLDLRLMQWAWWGLSVAFSLVMWQGFCRDKLPIASALASCVRHCRRRGGRHAGDGVA